MFKQPTICIRVADIFLLAHAPNKTVEVLALRKNGNPFKAISESKLPNITEQIFE